jgi:hypothetical protein
MTGLIRAANRMLAEGSGAHFRFPLFILSLPPPQPPNLSSLLNKNAAKDPIASYAAAIKARRARLFIN